MSKMRFHSLLTKYPTAEGRKKFYSLANHHKAELLELLYDLNDAEKGILFYKLMQVKYQFHRDDSDSIYDFILKISPDYFSPLEELFKTSFSPIELAIIDNEPMEFIQYLIKNGYTDFNHTFSILEKIGIPARFSDNLEHLQDPAGVQVRIEKVIPGGRELIGPLIEFSTTLQLAMKCERDDVVKFLISKGAYQVKSDYSISSLEFAFLGIAADENESHYRRYFDMICSEDPQWASEMMNGPYATKKQENHYLSTVIWSRNPSPEAIAAVLNNASEEIFFTDLTSGTKGNKILDIVLAPGYLNDGGLGEKAIEKRRQIIKIVQKAVVNFFFFPKLLLQQTRSLVDSCFMGNFFRDPEQLDPEQFGQRAETKAFITSISSKFEKYSISINKEGVPQDEEDRQFMTFGHWLSLGKDDLPNPEITALHEKEAAEEEAIQSSKKSIFTRMFACLTKSQKSEKNQKGEFQRFPF